MEKSVWRESAAKRSRIFRASGEFISDRNFRSKMDHDLESRAALPSFMSA